MAMTVEAGDKADLLLAELGFTSGGQGSGRRWKRRWRGATR